MHKMHPSTQQYAQNAYEAARNRTTLLAPPPPADATDGSSESVPVGAGSSSSSSSGEKEQNMNQKLKQLFPNSEAANKSTATCRSDSRSCSQEDEEEDGEEEEPRPQPQPQPQSHKKGREPYWKKIDEHVLIQALDGHYKDHGKLPPHNSYGAILPDVAGRLSFEPTVTQIRTKVNHFRNCYRSLSNGSRPFTEELQPKFQFWSKWFCREMVADENDIPPPAPADFACLSKVLEEAVKNYSELSDISACADHVKVTELIGLAPARILEAKLKKCKFLRMKMKAEELNITSLS